MGFVRQVMHKIGVRRNTPLAGWLGKKMWRKMALANLAALDIRRATLMQQVPEAETAEARAFAKVEPVAAAALAQR